MNISLLMEARDENFVQVNEGRRKKTRIVIALKVGSIVKIMIAKI